MRNHHRPRSPAGTILSTAIGVVALSCQMLAQEAAEPTGFLLAMEPESTQLATTAPELIVPPPYEIPGEAEGALGEVPEVKGLEGIAAFNERRFGYVVHGQTRAEYQSNLFLKSTDEKSDFIFTISPGVAVGLGDFKSELTQAATFRYRFEDYADKNFVFLDYVPSAILFVENSDENMVGHDVRLLGEYTFQKLTIGTRAQFLHASVPSEDISDRVKLTRISAAITSRYAFSGKISAEANFYYDDNRYDNEDGEGRGNVGLVDTQVFRTEEWLNFQALPKTTVGVGVTAGLLERSEGPSETYEQLQARVRWSASDKLAVQANAGIEFRQNDESGDQSYGIFGLGLTWTPTERASVILDAYRRNVPSGAAGEVFTNTGVELRYRQRLRERFYFELGGGFQHNDYQGDFEQGRQDDIFFARGAVGLALREWLTSEVTGEYRQDDSTVADRSFDNTIVAWVFNVLF